MPSSQHLSSDTVRRELAAEAACPSGLTEYEELNG
jgi:hypothetical protein